MTTTALTIQKELVSVEDLEVLGFSHDEIQALLALRAAYPFIEYVDTSSQWQRLQFLQWRYQHGDLQRT